MHIKVRNHTYIHFIFQVLHIVIDVNTRLYTVYTIIIIVWFFKFCKFLLDGAFYGLISI